MKKIVIITIVTLLFSILLLILPILMLSNLGGGGANSSPGVASGLSTATEGWRSAVETIAPQYGLEEYVDLILCIIEVESSGGVTSKDIMQASEFMGFKPNTITDPLESINAGCAALKDSFERAEINGITDLSCIVQGYNYGPYNYMEFMAANGGVWTLEYSQQYSNANGGFGDPAYAQKIMSYYKTVEDGENPSTPTNNPHDPVDKLGGASLQDLVNFACQYEGYPYVWGGENPETGADCSGFTLYIYGHYGISLPHSAASQAIMGTEVGSYQEAIAGDLIFREDGGEVKHVLLYIGDGKAIEAKGKQYGIVISEVGDSNKPLKSNGGNFFIKRLL